MAEAEGPGFLPGYRFRDPARLVRALTHPSAGPGHNQRLEFLGDAVIGLAVAELVLEAAEVEAREGPLTRARAQVVRREGLAAAARALDLGPALVLGEGEARAGGAEKDRILCDAFEAVAGAIFLDGGWGAAVDFCRARLGPAARRAVAAGGKDPKSRLQEAAQARGLGLPAYRVLSTSGAPHQPAFEVRVQVGCIRATGTGGSKKEAEREAAAAALATLDRHPEILPGPPEDEAP